MPSITFFDENRQRHIEIERIGHESYDLSQLLSVKVFQRDFQGNVQVWVDDFALRNFLKQLEECENLRRGEARLDAMSPQEFTLRIFNTRAKGDFAVAYEVGHSFDQCSAELRGQFAIDPSLLPQILHDFEQLLTI